MSRKKLMKLGISILAVNALGVAVYYTTPELQKVLTAYAAENPGEDEEIPDGEERQMALRFLKKLEALEGSIQEYKDLQDEDNKELLEADLEEATNYLPVAKAAMKSDEGKKGFGKYESRFNALKAEADALLGNKPTDKIETQEIEVTEPIPFPERIEYNAQLPEGTRNIKTPGVNGSKKVTYTITLTNGQETKREKKSQVTITDPVEQVVEVGTKKAPVVTTEEVKEKEVIKHGSRTEQNPALPKGTKNVKVTGVDGEKEITYTVTKEDGVEKSKVKKSEVITKPAVEEVIEEGTGPVITIKEETKTEEVDFQIKEVQNPDLAEGIRNVKTPGQKGVRTIVETVTYTDGVETSRVVKSSDVTTQPVDQVVEVGTKKNPVETKENLVVEEKVAFQEESKEDPNLDKGQTRVEEGQEGIDEVTYEVTKLDGVEQSRKEISRTTKTAPKNKVTYTGTKPVVTTKEETKTEEVAFKVVEVQNPDLAEGVRNVKTPGQKGVRTIVETVTYTDGVETSRVEKSNTVTTAPVDQVVEVGTKKPSKVETVDVTEENEIQFDVTEVPSADLYEGERKIVTPGKSGVESVVYTVTYTDGVETGRVEKSRTVTVQPVAEVVQVGTKKVEPSNDTVEKDLQVQTSIPYSTRTVANPAYPVGYRKVVQPGWNGIQTTTYTVTYDANGNEVKRVVKNTETTAPVEEVIEIGTAPAVTPTTPTTPVTPTDPNSKPDQNQGNQDSGKKDPANQDGKNPAGDSKQDGQKDKEVKEKGKSDKRSVTPKTEDAKKVLPNTGETNSGLLSMFGLVLAGLVAFFRRGKNKVD